MIAILWKCWDFVRYLLRPEDDAGRAPLPRLPGVVKTLFWTAVAVGGWIELGRAL